MEIRPIQPHHGGTGARKPITATFRSAKTATAPMQSSMVGRGDARESVTAQAVMLYRKWVSMKTKRIVEMTTAEASVMKLAMAYESGRYIASALSRRKTGLSVIRPGT